MKKLTPLNRRVLVLLLILSGVFALVIFAGQYRDDGADWGQASIAYIKKMLEARE